MVCISLLQVTWPYLCTLGDCVVILQQACHEVPIAPCPTTHTSSIISLLGLRVQEQNAATSIHSGTVYHHFHAQHHS